MAASLPEVLSLPYPTLVDGCRHPPVRLQSHVALPTVFRHSGKIYQFNCSLQLLPMLHIIPINFLPSSTYTIGIFDIRQNITGFGCNGWVFAASIEPAVSHTGRWLPSPACAATKPCGTANSILPLRQDLSIQLFSLITANFGYNPH